MTNGTHKSTILMLGVTTLFLLAGCEEGSVEMVDPPGQTEELGFDVLGETQAAEGLEDGTRQPLEMLVQATKPGPAKKTRTLEEARSAIESAELEPLRQALEAGGWDEEQRAQMLYFAGTHQSGAAEDSVRHRQQQLHDQLSTQLETFRYDLTAAAEKSDVKIAWAELKKAGVILKLETEAVQ